MRERIDDRYDVIRPLGVGTMGRVDLVLDTRENELRALKRLQRPDAETLARLREEFAALARIKHPNLVQVFDLGQLQGGGIYFTMEFLDGLPLERAVRPGDVPGALRAARDVLDGLDALHAAGYAHCDLKPANMLVMPGADGALETRIVDLGLAGKIGEAPGDRVRGTPGYVAPEIRGGGAYGRDSDLYALGASIYRVLSGRPAFAGRDAAEILEVQDRGAPTLLPLRAVNVPAALDAPLLGLLSPDPRHRAAAARDLREIARRRAGGDGRSAAMPDVLHRSGQVVGRDDVLTRVRETLLAKTGRHAAVLHGPHGAGKTRLAREIAIEAELLGRPVTWIERGGEAFELTEGALFVFEDFDAWPESALSSLHLPSADGNWSLLFVQGRAPRDGDALYRYLLRLENPPAPVLVGLTALEPAAADRLLTERLGGSVPSGIVSEIRTAAGSWPGTMLLELERRIQSGRLVRDGDGWREDDVATPAPPGEDDEGEALLARLGAEAAAAAVVVAGYPPLVAPDELAQVSGLDSQALTRGLEDLEWAGHVQSEGARRRIVPESLARTLRLDARDHALLPARERLRDRLRRLTSAAPSPNDEAIRPALLLSLGCHDLALGDPSGAGQHLMEAFEAALASSTGIADEATRLLVRLPGLETGRQADLLITLARRWREAGDATRSDELWTAARSLPLSGTDGRSAEWALEHAVLLSQMVKYKRALELLDGLVENSETSPLPPGLEGRVRSLRGWCRVRTGQREEGLREMHAAIEVLPEADLGERAVVHSRLGITMFLAGMTEDGSVHLDRSLELATKMGNPDIEARIRGNLGLRYRIEGRLEEADLELRRAYELLSLSGRLEQLPATLSNLLSTALDRCDWEGWSRFQELLESSSRNSGNPVALGRCYEGRATIGILRGNAREAARAMRKQRRWLSGDFPEEFYLYYRIQTGVLAGWLSDERKSARILERIRQRAQEVSIPAIEALASRCIAELMLIRNRPRDAKPHAEAVLKLRGADVSLAIPAVLTLARVALRCGDLVELERHIAASASRLKGDASPVIAPSREELEAYRAILSGQFTEAEVRVEAAAQGFRRLDLAPAEILLEWEVGLAYMATDQRAALEHLGRAHGIARRCGIVAWSHRIAEHLALVMRDSKHLSQQFHLTGSTDSRLLPKVIELANSLLEFPVLLQRALTLAAETIGASRGFILLSGESELELMAVAQHGGVDDAARSTALTISRTIVRRVTETGQAFLTDDAGSDPRLGSTQSLLDMAVRSLICVPLRTRDRVIGTIYLESRSTGAQFSISDLDLVESFAGLIAVTIENGRLHDELKRSRERIVGQNLTLRREVSKRYAKPNIIGQSPEIAAVLSDVERVAVARASVLITGESGTGKELIAKMIHYASPRADQSCVSLNCAAFPSDLIESELFGIEDRAATNVKGRIGIFEQAHGGTLFLDEIGDMPVIVQMKLLRVIQEREFTPIGGTKVRPVDFRLISATHQDLRKLIGDGRFRDDLYFRIHHLAIHIPPLRERKIDILLLADHFLQKFCEENSRPIPQMSPEFKATLLKSRWDGNVRELQYYVERIAVMSSGATLDPIFLPRDLDEISKAGEAGAQSGGQLGLDSAAPHRTAVDEFERNRILQALAASHGNQRQAAAALGMKESTFRYSLRKLGIMPDRTSARRRPRKMFQ